MTSVIIADNHPLIRAGVRQLIDAHPGYRLLDEAGDCDACLFKVRELRPDILLLDLNMPDTGGFGVVRALKTDNIPCRIVILSMYSTREFVDAARQLGCAGFVAKEDAGSELIEALNNLSRGFQMSSSVGRGEKPLHARDQTDTAPIAGMDQLTWTELRVLASVAASSTTQEIAQRMGISPRTVDTHRQNISRKLDLSGANSLVRYAAEHRQQITALLTDARTNRDH